MGNKKLTDLEEKIFTFICDFIDKKHYSPSVRDISKACYISVSVAYKYIMQLYEKEYINIVPNTSRSISVKR